MECLSIEIDIYKNNEHLYYEIETTENVHPTQEQLKYDGDYDLPMLNETPELKLTYAIDVLFIDVIILKELKEKSSVFLKGLIEGKNGGDQTEHVNKKVKVDLEDEDNLSSET